MNQPKPGTKAYRGLLTIAAYRNCADTVTLNQQASIWTMHLGGHYEDEFTSQAFHLMKHFIAGKREYVGGKLVRISNARVEVQFVPAEKKEDINGK